MKRINQFKVNKTLIYDFRSNLNYTNTTKLYLRIICTVDDATTVLKENTEITGNDNG